MAALLLGAPEAALARSRGRAHRGPRRCTAASEPSTGAAGAQAAAQRSSSSAAEPRSEFPPRDGVMARAHFPAGDRDPCGAVPLSERWPRAAFPDGATPRRAPERLAGALLRGLQGRHFLSLRESRAGCAARWPRPPTSRPTWPTPRPPPPRPPAGPRAARPRCRGACPRCCRGWARGRRRPAPPGQWRARRLALGCCWPPTRPAGCCPSRWACRRRRQPPRPPQPGPQAPLLSGGRGADGRAPAARPQRQRQPLGRATAEAVVRDWLVRGTPGLLLWVGACVSQTWRQPSKELLWHILSPTCPTLASLV